jgi:hypothetical protein
MKILLLILFLPYLSTHCFILPEQDLLSNAITV